MHIEQIVAHNQVAQFIPSVKSRNEAFGIEKDAWPLQDGLGKALQILIWNLHLLEDSTMHSFQVHQNKGDKYLPTFLCYIPMHTAFQTIKSFLTDSGSTHCTLKIANKKSHMSQVLPQRRWMQFTDSLLDLQRTHILTNS